MERDIVTSGRIYLIVSLNGPFKILISGREHNIIKQNYHFNCTFIRHALLCANCLSWTVSAARFHDIPRAQRSAAAHAMPAN